MDEMDTKTGRASKEELELPQQCQISPKASFVASVLCVGFAVASIIFSMSLGSCRASAMQDKSSLTSAVTHSLRAVKKPLVILISSDGFKWGYQWKAPTPNIERLTKEGTEAFPGMIPVYPSVTFSNHYSIATGLYPAWHGIIANSFRDPSDASRKSIFRKNDTNPKWWLGEPIWETVVKNGLKAATYFWPGSEVVKGKWTCPPAYCRRYNKSIPFEARIDAVLEWIDLPPSQRPSFISLYFHSPDAEAHLAGVDSPEITDAVSRVDSMVGKLLDGLEKRKILDDVSVILVSDHGMVGTCETKLISLEELWSAAKMTIPEEWIESYSPVLGIRPAPRVKDLKSVVSNLNAALASDKVANGKFLKLYLKQDLPERLHYSASDRIQPIVGMVAEGFKVVSSTRARSRGVDCGGDHGYDNSYASMRSIFVARGPMIARGKQVASFVNVEIYNVIAEILGITGAPNNGSKTLAKQIVVH